MFGKNMGNILKIIYIEGCYFRAHLMSVTADCVISLSLSKLLICLALQLTGHFSTMGKLFQSIILKGIVITSDLLACILTLSFLLFAALLCKTTSYMPRAEATWHPPMTSEPWYCKATAEQRKNETIILLASWSQSFFTAGLKVLSANKFLAYTRLLKCLLVKSMDVEYVSDQYNQKPTSNKSSVLSILEIPIKYTV